MKVYSPVITANMMFLDTGGSTSDDKDNITSIKGLPITALEICGKDTNKIWNS